MLNGNLDDFISGQIGSDWGVLATLANDISLVGLWKMLSVTTRQVCNGCEFNLSVGFTLPVHAQTVLITIAGSERSPKTPLCGETIRVGFEQT